MICENGASLTCQRSRPPSGQRETERSAPPIYRLEIDGSCAVARRAGLTPPAMYRSLICLVAIRLVHIDSAQM